MHWVFGGLVLCFHLSLLGAAVMDFRTRSVYDLYWWICLGTGLGILLIQSSRGALLLTPGTLTELTLIFGVQELLMARTYGRADSHCLCCCALYDASFGRVLEPHLLQLLLALGLLLLVQIPRRNITRTGRLLEPVAFLPYLTAAFWMSCLSLPGMQL